MCVYIHTYIHIQRKLFRVFYVVLLTFERRRKRKRMLNVSSQAPQRSSGPAGSDAALFLRSVLMNAGKPRRVSMVQVGGRAFSDTIMLR